MSTTMDIKALMNTDDINSEIDTSTPEYACDARLMQAYLCHLQGGGTIKSFLVKAQEMAEHIERVFAEYCKDDKPKPRMDA